MSNIKEERINLLDSWFDYLVKFPPQGTIKHIRNNVEYNKQKFIDLHKIGGIYENHWTNDEIQDEIFKKEERLLKKI